MKVAQLVSNFHKVGPRERRAIYSAAGLLCDALVARGHEVDLYGSADSQTAAKVRSLGFNALSSLELPSAQCTHYLHAHISNCFANAAKYDIIHSHFTLLSSFYSALTPGTPTVQSIHSPIDNDMLSVLRMYKNNNYISFSLAQRIHAPELNWVANIYHGVDTKLFTYNQTPGDYLLYLGRITEDKGVHLAIEAAKLAGEKLIIAGSSYPDEQYWQKQIEPHIDGVNVRYVGQADFYSKVEYLQQAKALLFPTQTQEAFGISMIEAMSCGTPVIGWSSGSIPEVVQDGETGYVVKTVVNMSRAIKALKKINRQDCRKRAEKLFSVEKMVSGYEKVFSRVIDRHQRNLAKQK